MVEITVIATFVLAVAVKPCIEMLKDTFNKSLWKDSIKSLYLKV